ncbi:MAG TPA: hypothetical protein PLI60_02660 [Anaerolineaceae bacterium]|nr:hypothetical protein [Anaerolineaceae bacterium]
MTDVFNDLMALRIQYQDFLLALPNVVGVGIGHKKTGGNKLETLGLVTLVRAKMPVDSLPKGAAIPSELDGFQTDVVEVGHLRVMTSRLDRWRPAVGGISTGHFQVTAGTLGCLVYDLASGEPLILSNNHVLANSNACSIHDPILQQGRIDGGIVGEDTLATLARFIPIRFQAEAGSIKLPEFLIRLGLLIAGWFKNEKLKQFFENLLPRINHMDAAVAKPLDPQMVVPEVLGIGIPSGTAAASLDMPVRKSGRTTGVTDGTIEVLNATVTVSYGDNLTARFENQIITSAMCMGGDSGSVLFSAGTSQVIGLLFGGSSLVTIYSPIEPILSALKVSLNPPAV